jgi:Sedlin, N-terminal conserved region
MDRISSILVGVAIIGKSNVPLYLCDCEKQWLEYHKSNFSSSIDGGIPIESDENDSTIQRQEETNDDKDPFGFVHHSLYKIEQRNSMPLSGQILIHAAIDNLEEQIERPGGKNAQMPVIRKSTNDPNTPPHWLGLLLDTSSDGYTVYGYITATNIKLMAIAKDVPTKNGIAIKLLQDFLKEVHQHYIAYLLNPFSDTRGGLIVSKQFDVGIANSIAKLKQPTVLVD